MYTRGKCSLNNCLHDSCFCHGSVNSTICILMFPVLICAIIICGIKSNKGQMICNGFHIVMLCPISCNFFIILYWTPLLICTETYCKHPSPPQLSLFITCWLVIPHQCGQSRFSLEWTIMMVWLDHIVQSMISS